MGTKISMAQVDLLTTITNVLGFSSKQLEVLYDDGYDTVSTIIYWKFEKISEWCTAKSKLTTTIGGYYYSN